MHRLRVPVLLNSIHHALIVSDLLIHNNKQIYCNEENIHLFIIKLHVALNIKKGKNERCYREVRGAAVIHGSARRNRPFHCSMHSVYLTFYCIILHDRFAYRTFRRQEKCFKCDLIHERPTNVCILPGF